MIGLLSEIIKGLPVNSVLRIKVAEYEAEVKTLVEANRELEEHYIRLFGAEHLGFLHAYQFFIDEEAARKLLEVYHYEWNEC